MQGSQAVSGKASDVPHQKTPEPEHHDAPGNAQRGHEDGIQKKPARDQRGDNENQKVAFSHAGGQRLGLGFEIQGCLIGHDEDQGSRDPPGQGMQGDDKGGGGKPAPFQNIGQKGPFQSKLHKESRAAEGAQPGILHDRDLFFRIKAAPESVAHVGKAVLVKGAGKEQGSSGKNNGGDVFRKKEPQRIQKGRKKKADEGADCSIPAGGMVHFFGREIKFRRHRNSGEEGQSQPEEINLSLNYGK